MLTNPTVDTGSSYRPLLIFSAPVSYQIPRQHIKGSRVLDGTQYLILRVLSARIIAFDEIPFDAFYWHDALKFFFSLSSKSYNYDHKYKQLALSYQLNVWQNLGR